MQKLQEYHGVPLTLRALRRLDLALPRVPELADHRPGVAARRGALTQARDAWDELVERRMAVTAELEYLDGEIDHLVVSLGQRWFLECDRNRHAPAYRKLFPVSPSTATAGVADEKQARFVTTLVETIHADAAYAALKAEAAALAGLTERLREAQGRRQELYAKEAQARAALDLAADEARRFYNGLYHQFTVALPDQPRLVESLFLSLSSAPATGGPVA